MEPPSPAACPLHGDGADPAVLVGRRVRRVTAAWHVDDGGSGGDPVEVWLADDRGEWLHVTTGSDWCLIVDRTPPHAGYAMGPLGRIEVRPVRGETPFARHLGRTVVAVRQDREPRTGRMGVEFEFPDGVVRCDGHAGELRLRG